VRSFALVLLSSSLTCVLRIPSPPAEGEWRWDLGTGGWKQGEDGVDRSERKFGHKTSFGCFPRAFPHWVKDSPALHVPMLCLVGPFLHGSNWPLCSVAGSWLLSRMTRNSGFFFAFEAIKGLIFKLCFPPKNPVFLLAESKSLDK